MHDLLTASVNRWPLVFYALVPLGFLVAVLGQETTDYTRDAHVNSHARGTYCVALVHVRYCPVAFVDRAQNITACRRV